MKGHGSQYERKSPAAIVALVQHRTIEEAAAAVGLTKKTLIRWLQMPAFQAASREALRAAVSQSSARLQQAAPAAASILLTIMGDRTISPATRARLAISVLDRAVQALTVQDIQARLAALEQMAKDWGKPQ